MCTFTFIFSIENDIQYHLLDIITSCDQNISRWISWWVVACILTSYACLHTHETWMRPFKSILFRYLISVLNICAIRLCCIILNWDLIKSQPCSTFHVKIGLDIPYLSVSSFSPLFLQIHNEFAFKFQFEFQTVVSVHFWLKRYSNHLLMRASWYVSAMTHTFHQVSVFASEIVNKWINIDIILLSVISLLVIVTSYVFSL